jgi:hypothetical protein
MRSIIESNAEDGVKLPSRPPERDPRAGAPGTRRCTRHATARARATSGVCLLA